MSKKNGAIIGCSWCGKGMYKPLSRLKRYKNHFCNSKECEAKFKAKYFSKENHSCWKPAKHVNNSGYLIQHCKPVHRTIVEGVIGRKLKRTEIVHHIDGDKLNNKKSNLLVCLNRYHMWLHQRMSQLYMEEHFQVCRPSSDIPGKKMRKGGK